MQYTCKNAECKQNAAFPRILTNWLTVSTHEDDPLDTPAKRVHDIRRRLGTSHRRPLAQAAFADMLNARAYAMGKACRFEGTMIGRIENGRDISIDEAAVIASVDPKRRGAAWLAWENEPDPFGDSLDMGTPMAEAEPFADEDEQPARKASGMRKRRPR